MADLKQFLDTLGLGQHWDVLARNDIDLDVLGELSDKDLAELGLSLGHRRKLIAAAQRRAPTPAPVPEAEAAAPRPRPSAAR